MPPPGQPPPDDRQTIVCLYCNKPQEVARRAVQITCKYCYKALKIEDIVVNQYLAQRNVETCGIVVVEKKGNVVVLQGKIHCGGLIVRGKVKASVLSRGSVLIGPEADLIGDVTAPTLAVGSGAVLNGYYRIGQPPDSSAA